jgi:hypothetical protein
VQAGGELAKPRSGFLAGSGRCRRLGSFVSPGDASNGFRAEPPYRAAPTRTVLIFASCALGMRVGLARGGGLRPTASVAERGSPAATDARLSRAGGTGRPRPREPGSTQRRAPGPKRRRRDIGRAVPGLPAQAPPAPRSAAGRGHPPRALTALPSLLHSVYGRRCLRAPLHDLVGGLQVGSAVRPSVALLASSERTSDRRLDPRRARAHPAA